MDDTSLDRTLRPPLNFNIASYEYSEFGETPLKKSRMSRDPISHRIIEKRRRDRMNNCLADLSQLIPDNYLKQGQGRIEKTEIIELSIKHIRNLQTKVEEYEKGEERICCKDKFVMGYKECSGEVQRYLVENQGYPSDNPLAISMLHHLQEQLKKFQTSNHRTPMCGEGVANQNECFSMEWDKEKVSEPVRQDPEESVIIVGDDDAIKVMDDSPTSSHVTNGSGLSLTDLDKNTDNNTMLRNLDKHVRTLLSRGDVSSNNAERINRLQSLMTGQTPSGWSDSGLSADGGISSAPTSSETGSHRDTLSSKQLAYKYKNDIKMRFSADNLDKKRSSSCSINGFDDMPSWCKEEESPDKLKDCLVSQNESHKSESTSYPSSDMSTNGNTSSGSNGNVSNGSNGEGSSRASNSPSESSASTMSGPTGFDLSNSVPGFALHPAGTYYIPVVSPASQLLPFLQNYGTSGICHPISIPVNFGGPFICTPNVRLSPHSKLGSGYKFKRETGQSGGKRGNSKR